MKRMNILKHWMNKIKPGQHFQTYLVRIPALSATIIYTMYYDNSLFWCFKNSAWCIRHGPTWSNSTGIWLLSLNLHQLMISLETTNNQMISIIGKELIKIIGELQHIINKFLDYSSLSSVEALPIPLWVLFILISLEIFN